MPRTPGDVIHWITHERQEVHHLLRAESPFRHQSFRSPELVVCAFASSGTQDVDAFGEELEEVLVRGDAVDMEACAGGRACQRGDEVIGFVARELNPGNAQGIEQLLDVRKLRCQVLRWCLPGGFVGGVLFVPEGWGGGIEGDSEQLGMVLPQQEQQHVRKAEGGEGGLPRGGMQPRAHERVVGAEDQRHAIDQIQLPSYRGHGREPLRWNNFTACSADGG
jgi:hypothetical protein